jgi:hypothetical protein
MPTKPSPDPAEPDLILKPGSFTSPERMECQVRFDAPFDNLLDYTFTAVDPRREGLLAGEIVARDGTRAFPDQIIQFMLWVQAKRDDPDVQLEQFDSLTLAEIRGARLRALLGKAGSGNGRSTSSSPVPASSDSSVGD